MKREGKKASLQKVNLEDHSWIDELGRRGWLKIVYFMVKE